MPEANAAEIRPEVTPSQAEADEAVGGTDQLHDVDLLAAVKDGDLDGVADDHDADGQHQDAAVAGVGSPLQRDKDLGHLQRGVNLVTRSIWRSRRENGRDVRPLSTTTR